MMLTCGATDVVCCALLGTAAVLLGVDVAVDFLVEVRLSVLDGLDFEVTIGDTDPELKRMLICKFNFKFESVTNVL